jgi:hypothetical protein
VGPPGTFAFLGIFLAGGAAALYPFRDVLLDRDLGTNPLAIAPALALLAASAGVSRLRRRHLKLRILAGLPEVSPERHGARKWTRPGAQSYKDLRCLLRYAGSRAGGLR